MNANDLIADIQLEPSWTGEERTILLRALRLLAAAEANDGSTPETDARLIQGMFVDADLSRQFERERNALAARARELEADIVKAERRSERLKFHAEAMAHYTDCYKDKWPDSGARQTLDEYRAEFKEGEK